MCGHLFFYPRKLAVASRCIKRGKQEYLQANQKFCTSFITLFKVAGWFVCLVLFLETLCLL